MPLESCTTRKVCPLMRVEGCKCIMKASLFNCTLANGFLCISMRFESQLMRAECIFIQKKDD